MMPFTWRSMRGDVLGKIISNIPQTNAEGKLFRILEQNPDLDHYLCDHERMRYWVGVTLGIMSGLALAVVIGWGIAAYCHAMGWLHIPGGAFA